MGLTLIEGYMGSGKTLLTTDIALTSKVPVICNYKIKSNNVYPLELDELLHLTYPKCKVILDEAYTYLESRTSMNKLNLYMSYILFQSRKRGIDFIVTAQLADTIDSRFRDLCDIWIVAKQVKDGFLYAISDKQIIQFRKISFSSASKIWDKYDTTEVILPPQIQDLETTIGTLDRKKLKLKIDVLEKKFYREYQNIPKVTHSIVKAFLLDNDESEIYEEYLYPRLHKNEVININK